MPLGARGGRLGVELRELERANLLAVLAEHRWKIAGPGGAAAFLGIRPTTLTSRMQAMGIYRPGTEPRE